MPTGINTAGMGAGADGWMFATVWPEYIALLPVSPLGPVGPAGPMRPRSLATMLGSLNNFCRAEVSAVSLKGDKDVIGIPDAGGTAIVFGGTGIIFCGAVFVSGGVTAGVTGATTIGAVF